MAISSKEYDRRDVLEYYQKMGMLMKDNLLTSVNSLVHYLLQPYLSKDAVALDATVGRGHDTLFLCENCRMVYGFDIQPEALRDTEKLLKEHGLSNYQLFLQPHQQLDSWVREPLDAVMFNLGYLPSGDKSVTTVSETTLTAMEKALKLLKKGGVMTLVVYSHPEGLKEKEAVTSYVRTLDPQVFHVLHLQMANQPQAPEIIMITRKKEE